MWGKRPGNRSPAPGRLCGYALFSRTLTCTLRSSRRSSDSLCRPDTHRHRSLRIPASTWNCSKWPLWVVVASRRGESSSAGKRNDTKIMKCSKRWPKATGTCYLCPLDKWGRPVSHPIAPHRRVQSLQIKVQCRKSTVQFSNLAFVNLLVREAEEKPGLCNRACLEGGPDSMGNRRFCRGGDRSPEI